MKTTPGFRTLLALVVLVAFACTSYAQPVTIFGYTNLVWRYHEDSLSTDNPGATFMQPGFDDTVAGWKTGRALFGNDDSGVYNGVDDPFTGGINGFATPLNRLINGAAARVTFYFRAHFNFPFSPANVIIYTTNYLDDGHIVYINGQEAGRMRMPTGPVTWDTLGSNPPTEGIPYFLELPATALVQGDNVLAVEVHQSSTGSSDVAFAMNMTAIIPFPPRILDTTQPTNRVIQENRTTTLACISEASPPINFQWFQDGAPIPDGTNSTYRIALMAASNAGDYFCRVSNPVGSVDTRTATVGYTEDTSPPVAVSAMGNSAFNAITIAYDHLVDPVTSVDGFNYGVRDQAGNVISITGITLSPNGFVVTLALETLMTPDTQYFVDLLGGISDLAGNEVVGAELPFRSFVPGCGGLLLEAYRPLSTTDNRLDFTLLVDPNYPHNPNERLRMSAFDTRTVYPDNALEGYGARVRGIFVPNVSGNYIFYLGSDDSSRLWLNPAGPGATGKQLIIEETGCCNDWVARVSTPQALVAGHGYYVEAIYKEGTGGDYLKVSARLEEDGRPPDNPNGQVPVSEYAIPGTMLGSPAGPSDILAGVTIGSQPANTTVLAGSGARATFTVVMSPDVPGCYQWKRDGVDIPGATGDIYSFVPVPADNGAKFSVVVNLMGGHTRTSAEATLTVIEDTTRPTLVSASTDLNHTNIVVTFSESMDPVTAGTPGNYAIAGSTVQSATVAGAVVTLVVNPPVADCVAHVLTVTGVRDPSANLINPNPASTTFTAPLQVLPITVHPWRYEDLGSDLGDGWAASAFDDSSWSNGAPTFAFPAGEVIAAGYPVVTVLSGVRPTTYFRTHFNLPTGPSTVTNLQLTTILDDGAIFYLNGTELTRIRMPAGAVTAATLTTAGSPSDPPQILETFTVPSTALKSGDNVLAARVHQSAATSSDTVFAAGLAAFISSCQQDLKLSISLSGGIATITSTGPGTIHGAPAITGPWTPIGPGPLNVPATGIRFFQIRP